MDYWCRGMAEEDFLDMPVDQVMDRLHTSLSGLTPEEVAARQATYGPNAVMKEKKSAVLRQFIGQFKNPLILILFLAAVLSAFLGEFVDAIIIIVIVFVSVVIDFFQEYRAGRAVELLKEKISTMATVTRDGVLQDVPLSDLVPGDIITLSAGNIVPADARVIQARDFFVDQSALTGESFPVEKTAQIREGQRTGPGAVGYLPVHELTGRLRHRDCSGGENRYIDRVREDCRTIDSPTSGNRI